MGARKRRAPPPALEREARPPPPLVPSGVVIPLPPELADAVAHYAELGSELVTALRALAVTVGQARARVSSDVARARRARRRR